jgi:hypothetical protein
MVTERKMVSGGTYCGAVDAAADFTAWRTRAFKLVEFVVQQEMGHAVVDQPALMGVCIPDVGRLADDGHGRLVRYIVDGQGIFIVSEANLLAEIFRGRTLVDDTLRVVDVAACANTTR